MKVRERKKRGAESTPFGSSYDLTANTRSALRSWMQTRILLLGDSFFWAFNVDDEDIVSESLEKDRDAFFGILSKANTLHSTHQ